MSTEQKTGKKNSAMGGEKSHKGELLLGQGKESKINKKIKEKELKKKANKGNAA